MKLKTISISEKNSKMGDIPSFSTTAGKTCTREACETCFKSGCYARSMQENRAHPGVGDSWERNTSALADLSAVESELNGYMMVKFPRFFRFHVSGDCQTIAQFDMYCRVAAKNPNIKYLMFTKAYHVVNSSDAAIPDNFSVVFSAWPGLEFDNPKQLPIAYMQDGTETRIPESALACPGLCTTCGMCWQINKLKRDVYFPFHGPKSGKKSSH
jgi:hypothetical protein